ncbi:MAG: heterodisulfide reductase-related iron-sulfur binding cluster, partial [bacterium]
MQTSPIEKILLAILVIVSIALFLQPLIIRYKAIMSAKGSFDFDRIPDRIARWFREVFFQGTVIAGRPLPGLMHAFVFWAFIVFAFETLDLMTRMFGYPVGIFGDGAFHHFYQGIVAIFAILASVGILYLFVRRFFFRPPALGDHLSWSSGVVAFFIVFLMVTYLLGIYTFADKPLEFKINAWLHIIVILAFLVLIPRSKHLHLFLSLLTTFLKDFELARIKPLNLDPEADEETWELGAEKLTDLTKKTALDAFTCVECGRCFEQCPARFTGKKLDPKQFMLNLRAAFLAKSKTPLLEDENFNSIIWNCTTCGACTFQCPVGIDQVVPQIEIRRGSVSNGIFPDAMRPLFDNLESVGNPWLYQPNDAATFIKENNFPEYSKGIILWWMGCMARYDDHYRKVALAFKKLLDAAKVDYGVLVEEQCTGDAARRAGNELLFQTLAGVNIEMLNEADPETIVTSCPHCLRTLREYKDLGLKENIKIVHHTQFLVDLIKDGKLKIERKPNGKVTYHDACYLSRYGEDKDYLNPRELIESAGGVLFEPMRTKRMSFCCGAGGGMLFTEETEGTRINHERVDELMKIDADTYAIACPF